MKKHKRFTYGDRVFHVNRGLGTFQCLCHGFSCQVIFDETPSQTEEVTLSLVHRHEPNKKDAK